MYGLSAKPCLNIILLVRVLLYYFFISARNNSSAATIDGALGAGALMSNLSPMSSIALEVVGP